MADEATVGEIESEAEARRYGVGEAALWVKKVQRAKKDEETWMKKAKEAVAIYEADDSKEGAGPIEFNILHSNVETTVPALYNSTPIPDIRRRFGDADNTAKQAVDVMERGLSYSIDQYDFDGTVREAARDGEIAGRGQVRIRYEPDEQFQKTGQGYQKTTCELVPWDKWGRGPARSWELVPFIYFEHDFTKKQLEKIGVKGDRLKRLTLQTGHDYEHHSDTKSTPDPKGILKTVPVYEIWDKDSGHVYWVTPQDTESMLAVHPDPLHLVNFYPVPKPLQPLRKRADITPICPYEIYKPLVKELENVTRRIRALVAQCKVRGIYNAKLTASLEQLKDCEDGEYIAAEDASEFVTAGGGLDKQIAHWPLVEIITVIKELYVQREQIKQIIYEVTGLSDVQRGATDANETLGAQQLKMQQGSQRLNTRQMQVAVFCRDLLRIKAEIICEHYTAQNLSVMTGIQVTPEVEEIIRSDMLRSFRIDIETDSTIRADLARSQEQMTRFLEGTAAYGQAMVPVVQAFPNSKQAIAEIYTSFARNFKLGKSAEDALDQLGQAAAQPEEPKPDPEQMKVQAQIEGDKAKLALQQQADQQKAGLEQQKMQAQLQADEQKLQLEIQKMQMEIEFKREELALKRETMAMDIQAKQQMAQLDMQNAQVKAEAERESIAIKREGMRADLDAKDEMHEINARAAEAKAKAAGKPSNGASA